MDQKGTWGSYKVVSTIAGLNTLWFIPLQLIAKNYMDDSISFEKYPPSLSAPKVDTVNENALAAKFSRTHRPELAKLLQRLDV